MTLDEAVQAALNQIAGITKALQVASQNGGKPIVGHDGRPMQAHKPPALGDLILTILNVQSIELQILRNTAASLAIGFALSDQEANRIADLVLERIKRADEPGHPQEVRQNAV